VTTYVILLQLAAYETRTINTVEQERSQKWFTI